MILWIHLTRDLVSDNIILTGPPTPLEEVAKGGTFVLWEKI